MSDYNFEEIELNGETYYINDNGGFYYYDSGFFEIEEINRKKEIGNLYASSINHEDLDDYELLRQAKVLKALGVTSKTCLRKAASLCFTALGRSKDVRYLRYVISLLISVSRRRSVASEAIKDISRVLFENPEIECVSVCTAYAAMLLDFGRTEEADIQIEKAICYNGGIANTYIQALKDRFDRYALIDAWRR